MREFSIPTDGYRLFGVEDGDGCLVVMLHGGLATHAASLRFVSALIPRFHVVAPDLRSSGKSWDARPLDWDRLADDVALLMDHFQANRAVLGGVSSGTGVVLRCALRSPERLVGLVLVTPVYGGAEQGLTAEQAATFRAMDELGRRAPADGVQVLRPLYENLPESIRARALAILEGFDAGSVAATTHFLASGAQPFASVSDLRAVGVPTLLVPGGDALHPSEVAERYAANLPSCHLLRDPDADVPAEIATFCERVAV